MSGVEYFEPRTIDEACELAQRYADDGKLLAGGTALVLLMRQGLLAPEVLVNLQHVAGLAGVSGPGANGGGGSTGFVTIGGLTTHTQAARSAVLRSQFPALATTFAKVATPRIRNAGTLGGNLAHGDPHLDPPVTLLALDARVQMRSVRGQREISLTEFFRDYYETALAPDEILTRVMVPVPLPGSGAAFIKFLPRSQDDYATVDVAAWVRPRTGDGGGEPVLEEVRLAFGSVGATPFRAVAAERLLTGQRLSAELLAEVGELAAQACDPEDDVRGSAAYKRELVRVLLRRVLRQAVTDSSRNDTDGA